jgi:UDP-N-acetylglucosamine 1-carboxyvinyltransferase
MARFVIRGGKSLSGTVRVQGAKNAALKLIAGSLLSEEPCVLENVPNIVDVEKMLNIVRALGAEVREELEAHRVTITARHLDPTHIPEDEVRSFRASIVLLGPLLVRCGAVTMPYPGGDVIGARPITAHLKVLEQFGVEVRADGVTISARVPKSGLRAGMVILPEFSVTATENALFLASGIPRESRIEIAALEPHVRDLAMFLTAMGADIRIGGPHEYLVRGTNTFRGVTHHTIPDILDAFAFLVASILTRGEVSVGPIDEEAALLPLAKLREMGVPLSVRNGRIETIPNLPALSATMIQAMPYPGIPTDLQPLFALLATQAEGTTLIHDPLYENRFRYVEELVRMGANASLLDAHRIVVNGPTPLTGVPITSFDIRAGSVLVVAGLVAHGTTEISDIEHIDRGYEDFDGRLRALGADIVREG